MPPKFNRPPRPPRDEEDSGRPAKKMGKAEREAKRRMGGALPVEEVLPVEPKEEVPAVAELFAAAEAQEKAQEVAEVKPSQEAAPVPPALAELYGDKTPPKDVLDLYGKLGKKKQEGYIEHLKETLAKEEIKKVRRASRKTKKDKVYKTARMETKPQTEVTTHEFVSRLPKETSNLEAKRSIFKKAHEMFGLADGTAENYSQEYESWLKANAKESSPETEEQFRQENKEKYLGHIKEFHRVRGSESIEEVAEVNPTPGQTQEEIWQAQADADLASAQRNRREVPQEVLDRISRTRKQNELDAKEGVRFGSSQELTQEQKDAELLSRIRAEDETGDKKRAEAREQATKEALEKVGRSLGVEVDTIDAGHTPKEWKDKLKEAVGKIEDLEIQGMPELGGRAKKAEIYSRRRLKDLDAEVRELGVVEKAFRSWGEKYDKLGWKSKLAVGLSLGVGAGVGSAVSMPLAFACLSGVAAQRVAGLSSMFLKYEKSTSDEKWLGIFGKKEKAMAKAIRNQALMTAGMLGLVWGVREGVEHHDAVLGWLKNHWPGHGAHTAVAPEAQQPAAAAAAGAHAGTAEMQPAAAGAHAPEVVAPAHAEMPSVGATRGHGYEYMMKRLWEQLQEKHVSLPTNADPHSDLAKLLAADESSIDKVVHQLASDPKHGFFHGGESVRVGPSAHMTIGTDGQIHFSDAAHPDMVHAAEGMRTTPALHHEVPAAHAETPVAGESHVRLEQPSAEHTAPHVEIPVAQEGSYIIPEPTRDMGPSVSPHDMGPSFTVEGDIAKTPFGLEIPLKEPHVYMGWDNHTFVYGGDALDRANMIQSYLAEHPDGVVYSPDNTGTYRVPWSMVGGQATPGAPVHTRGLFGLFKSFMKAPDPADMKELIK